MARRNEATLYIGTNRFVVAVDALTGDERWRRKLEGGGHNIVSLLVKGSHVFAGCGGRVYCLERASGEIVWKNGLPGTGFHALLLAMDEGDQTATGALVSAQAKSSAQRQSPGAY